MTDLRKAAEAVLERWDSPAWEWKKQGPTADLMANLRKALAAEPTKQESVESDDDEEFTRQDVTTLLLEVMDWTYAKAHRERPMTEAEQKVLDDIRTALAAEQPKPVAVFDEQMGHPVLLLGSSMLKDKQPLYTAPPATHPGYVIGSHWLETAYSRICAGEAEADVLRDCGWERVDDAEALRRDAERYRWLRERAWFQFEFDGRYGDSGETVQELDAAIDAAMGDKT